MALYRPTLLSCGKILDERTACLLSVQASADAQQSTLAMRINIKQNIESIPRRAVDEPGNPHVLCADINVA